MRAFRQPGLLLLFILASAPLRANIAPEVVTRCKQATAFLLVGDDESATAFHIGDGLYVSNAHAVEDASSDHKLRLILDAGESTQRVIAATVLRTDKQRDLALLKIDDPKLPPALELGTTTSLVETTGIAAFGYPFGTDLNVGKNEYPNITVSTGHITALRKEHGKIQQIQIDASLNPGNSGGPVVSNAGQVLGVVQSGIEGSGVNFAIPVDQLHDFLYGAVISLQAPALTRVVPGKADTIAIDIPAEMAGSRDLTISLALSSTIQDQRFYKPTSAGGGHFTLTAPLAPAPEADLLEATVEENGSTWSLRIKDHAVKVGGRPIRLKSLREIVAGTAPGVVFTSGQKGAGAVTGLDDVETMHNGKPALIDLSGASRIRLAPANVTITAVRYEVRVLSGDKLLAHQEGAITADGVRPAVIRAQEAEDKPEPPERPVAKARLAVTIDGVKYVTASPQETLTATFTRPDGGVTTFFYSGYVVIRVSGVGQAYSHVYNDAFYLFTGSFMPPKNGHDGGFYQLAFGTSPLEGSSLASNAKNFIVGDLPEYSPDHEYTFVLDTRLNSPGPLHFGVSDAGYNDNSGAYTIQVAQLVPAPLKRQQG